MSRALDALYRQQAALEARRDAAAAAMQAAEQTGDDDAWDRAAEAHDAASDEIGPVDRAIWELEEAGDAGPRGFAAMYFAIKV